MSSGITVVYSALLHAHSGWRWILLALMVAAIVQAFLKMRAAEPINATNRKLSLYAFIATHLQLTFGLVLYFISPKVDFALMSEPLNRFFTVEHLSGMLFGITLITVGYLRAKKSLQFKDIFWFYLVGLLVILAMIPYPFQGYGANWF